MDFSTACLLWWFVGICKRTVYTLRTEIKYPTSVQINKRIIIQGNAKPLVKPLMGTIYNYGAKTEHFLANIYHTSAIIYDSKLKYSCESLAFQNIEFSH